MRSRTLAVGAAAAAATALIFGSGGTAVADVDPVAAAAAAAAKPDQHVVVMLREQPAAEPVGSAEASKRAKAIAKAQAPVISTIKSRASGIKGFRTRDAFAATVTEAAAADLRANPAVAAVVPDTTITLGKSTLHTTRSGGGAPSGSASDVCSATPRYDESATAVRAVSDDPKAVTARSLGYTGAGTKVAFIAEGIDIHNVNLRRDPADPSSTIFSDYKDFSTDGPNAPTSGAEAFLDANAIAGQGEHVYDVDGYSATPTGRPCAVRIEGVAPGASLVGLKVFSAGGATSLSGFLQAIDYAVQHDHVDVLNESFGANPFPDRATENALNQFDEAAVAAGVTVTVSSGDSGPFNTTGTPATDPKVIAVGASTTFRYYAQTNEGAARVLGPKGWENDNISALSSSGVSQTGTVLNVVAPGDLSWASCTPDLELYADCFNDNGEPSDIESSGGTSESAPLTAGTAALVIQAYKQSHHGAKPSPATVKHIITSTATDLGAPADEQGAGLVNAAAAVQLAASIEGGAAKGATLLKSVDELIASGRPGSGQRFAVTLTNEGTATQHLRLGGRTLGAAHTVASGAVTLTDGGATVEDGVGRTDNVRKVTFSVKPGQSRLLGSIAYQADPAGPPAAVRIALVDPKGRFAAYSLPQGAGNYGTAEVTRPQAGTWTAFIYSGTTAFGGVVGRVPYRISTQADAPFGVVSRSSVTLAPGARTTVSLAVRTPASPGDRVGALVVHSDLAGTSTVPVALRSTIDVAHHGRFTGVLGGGNGRDVTAQQNSYVFDVPKGSRSITANLSLANDPSNLVGLYLVGPGGDTEGYGQNTLGATSTTSATAWALDPTPGRWTLTVAFATPVAGDEVSDPFTGSVVLNGTSAAASGLPDSASVRLAAGTPVTVPVTVRNDGRAPAQFFIDARKKGSAIVPLAELTGAASFPVPSDGVTVPEWFVPTESSRIVAASVSTVPSQFDLFAGTGAPDVESRSAQGFGCAKAEAASYASRDRTVSGGIWAAQPSTCGPYAGAASSGSVRFGAAVVTRPFDTAVTSTTGDPELIAVDPSSVFAPIVVAPGGTATIAVTITPIGKPGTVVRGDLFVDTLLDGVPPYLQLAGDEVASLPYAYTIR